MSIIKGKTNIVAGFGGTKRPLGEVYFSQSSLASDNPGALPGWTGEYYENGKTLFPDLYNFVKAHSELQVTKAEYDSAITTYGECPKYVVDENTAQTSLRLPKRQTAGRYLVKKEVNGNNWYALYSDGWLEQGARYETNVNIEHITFFKPFASVPLVLTSVQSTSRTSYNDFGIDVYNLTTTGFTKQDLRAVGMGWGWEAKGYAAGTPMGNIKYPWISAFTSTIPASTAQAAEFTGALSGKANTDLSNVLANIDYVVESVVNTDGSWYRKYKSGWLEQGNSSPTGDQSFTLNKTITFPKPFADNNYTLVGPGFFISNAGAQTITRTSTGFTTSSVQNGTGCVFWYACGQGAN